MKNSPHVYSQHVYEVQIAGLPLKLRSSHDQDTVNQLAKLVDEKLRETQDSAPNITFQNALILTALNMAEDLMLLRQSALREVRGLEGRTQKILDQLENHRSTQSVSN
jgi:cell division protein ZapA